MNKKNIAFLFAVLSLIAIAVSVLVAYDIKTRSFWMDISKGAVEKESPAPECSDLKGINLYPVADYRIAQNQIAFIRTNGEKLRRASLSTLKVSFEQPNLLKKPLDGTYVEVVVHEVPENSRCVVYEEPTILYVRTAVQQIAWKTYIANTLRAYEAAEAVTAKREAAKWSAMWAAQRKRLAPRDVLPHRH